MSGAKRRPAEEGGARTASGSGAGWLTGWLAAPSSCAAWVGRAASPSPPPSQAPANSPDRPSQQQQQPPPPRRPGPAEAPCDQRQPRRPGPLRSPPPPRTPRLASPCPAGERDSRGGRSASPPPVPPPLPALEERANEGEGAVPPCPPHLPGTGADSFYSNATQTHTHAAWVGLPAHSSTRLLGRGAAAAAVLGSKARAGREPGARADGPQSPRAPFAGCEAGRTDFGDNLARGPLPALALSRDAEIWAHRRPPGRELTPDPDLSNPDYAKIQTFWSRTLKTTPLCSGNTSGACAHSHMQAASSVLSSVVYALYA